MSLTSDASVSPFSTSQRPPAWLFAATGALGVMVLAMAVAETNLWLHYLIDGGEYVSLLGLVFIAIAGVALHRQGRLAASLPLAAPWLLFPLITQGDQIIDNLPINAMRAMTHVILAAIFATPVAVIVLAVRAALPRLRRSRRLMTLVPGLRSLAEGRVRQGTARLAAALLVCEIGMAVAYLGALMVATLIVMAITVLWWGSTRPIAGAARRRSERSALVLLMASVAASFALYIGYKNRPGAYQGSPSFLMDPRQQASGYAIDRVAVPDGPVVVPDSTERLRAALTGYGRTLRRMVEGYYILDRNYTWDFHNELLLRRTPVLAGYRAVGLQKVSEAREMRAEADRLASAELAALAEANPLAAALEDVRSFVSFNFDRAVILESMSAGFEKTPAGLQHAAHLYEGEGKVLSLVLARILEKHRKAIECPEAAAFAGEFLADTRGIVNAYAGRVVGF